MTFDLPPNITNQPASRTVVWGGSTVFSVALSGVGPFTYQWLLDGVPLPTNLMTTVAGGGADDPATAKRRRM